MNENQTQQTTEQKPEKKGFIDQFKGMNLIGYLCLALVVKGVVAIVGLVTNAFKK